MADKTDEAADMFGKVADKLVKPADKSFRMRKTGLRINKKIKKPAQIFFRGYPNSNRPWNKGHFKPKIPVKVIQKAVLQN